MGDGDRRGVAPLKITGNTAENWIIWRARFENYLIAAEINKKDEKTQCAQLLHYIGEDGFKIYTTFQFADNEKDKIKVLLEKFQSHFEGKQNISYERYKFFSLKQLEGQTTENFVTELKTQAGKCKLDQLQDSLTVTMIICGIRNVHVREKLLQEDNLELDKAVELCRVIESSKLRSEIMGSSVGAGAATAEINEVNRSRVKDRYVPKTINDCNKCGQEEHIAQITELVPNALDDDGNNGIILYQAIREYLRHNYRDL
ncbi:uncharacterized protein LOC116182874 [Photinus pyralis]|uniref:uncharacterized protein LOC116182874 n=1 Tax=Photinus pyralis TaxID=7054 RepID=UPI001266F69F|nr:uncharacterized protein LOC116182874 [Photinus pyralis]